MDHEKLQFHASPDGILWRPIGPGLEAGKISDDYGSDLHFTGAMAGICCQDLNGTGHCADFDYFTLQPHSAA